MSAASKPVTVEAQVDRPKTLERTEPPQPPAAVMPTKEELLKLHVAATNERICEVVESIAIAIGDERLLAQVDAELKLRGLKIAPKRHRPKKPRRYTVFMDVETGVALNAYAKAEGKNRFFLIADMVRAQLGLPPRDASKD